jgi:hypothetical protein
LLDLDALVWHDPRSEDIRRSNGSKEGLMSPSLVVVDVLPDDSPFVRIENFLAEDLIGVYKTIKNKPV